MARHTKKKQTKKLLSSINFHGATKLNLGGLVAKSGSGWLRHLQFGIFSPQCFHSPPSCGGRSNDVIHLDVIYHLLLTAHMIDSFNKPPRQSFHARPPTRPLRACTHKLTEEELPAPRRSNFTPPPPLIPLSFFFSFRGPKWVV